MGIALLYILWIPSLTERLFFESQKGIPLAWFVKKIIMFHHTAYCKVSFEGRRNSEKPHEGGNPTQLFYIRLNTPRDSTWFRNRRLFSRYKSIFEELFMAPNTSDVNGL